MTGVEVPPAPCDEAQGTSFVCGADHPEDLVLIPGTQWIVASGFNAGSGIKLIDARSRTLRRWYTGNDAQLARDERSFPQCPSPPDAAALNAQGLSIRQVGDHTNLLYVANHGGREAIEVFRIESAAASEPSLQWIGCVPMPPGMAANSVATFPDGAVLVTVLTRPGTQIADFVEGRFTGLVYEWKPGTRAFEPVRGAELPGNNGLEVSGDGKEFYVVAFGWHAVVTFAHTNPTRILRKAVAPDFMPDNIHWDGDDLIAAGMRYDEPACGGLRKVVDGKADPMLCHRGYSVARLDPKSLTWRLVAHSEPNRAFNGASTGLVVGDELWIGSYQADRIAIHKLPQK